MLGARRVRRLAILFALPACKFLLELGLIILVKRKLYKNSKVVPMHPVLMMRLLKSMLLGTEGQPVVGLAVVLALLTVISFVLPEHWL